MPLGLRLAVVFVTNLPVEAERATVRLLPVPELTLSVVVLPGHRATVALGHELAARVCSESVPSVAGRGRLRRAAGCPTLVLCEQPGHRWGDGRGLGGSGRSAWSSRDLYGLRRPARPGAERPAASASVTNVWRSECGVTWSAAGIDAFSGETLQLVDHGAVGEPVGERPIEENRPVLRVPRVIQVRIESPNGRRCQRLGRGGSTLAGDAQDPVAPLVGVIGDVGG